SSCVVHSLYSTTKSIQHQRTGIRISRFILVQLGPWRPQRRSDVRAREDSRMVPKNENRRRRNRCFREPLVSASNSPGTERHSVQHSLAMYSSALGLRVFRCSECRSRSEEHTSELQSRFDLVCRLLLEKK